MISNEFWAKYFKVYDRLNLFPSYVELLTSICQELRPEPGSLVLDIGSGTGNLAMRLKGMGCQVVALDFCRTRWPVTRQRVTTVAWCWRI